MNILTSLILATDGYKTTHYLQYPEGTEYVSSYIEPRKYDTNLWSIEPEVLNFGVQAFIKQYLLTPFTQEDIDFAEALFATGYTPFFNKEGWQHILKEHDGFLPIEIQSLPEGMPFPILNAQVQLRNTDPKVPWLTSYVETALLRAIWYPSTVGTVSREIKKSAMKHLEETCDDPAANIGFRLNDFGARGAASNEAAMLGGMAHLVNFQGSDTIIGIAGAMKYYNATGFIGATIPASEHSTITSWGGPDKEIDAFRNMISQFGAPGALYACVSDSYDIYRAVKDYWGTELKDEILGAGGTLVIRPDSGDPLAVLRSILNILEEKFGVTVNQKGFKVLHPSIRIIQGDGVNPTSIRQIMRVLAFEGWSSENIAFGMGGALLQRLDRDSLGYAMKASEIVVSGEARDVYKDPVTDTGKRSKRGRLAVIRDGSSIRTIRESELGDSENLLRPVYRDGKLLNEVSFDTVRKNAAI